MLVAVADPEGIVLRGSEYPGEIVRITFIHIKTKKLKNKFCINLMAA